MKEVKHYSSLKKNTLCLTLGLTGYFIQYFANALVSNNTSPAVYGYFSLTIHSVFLITTVLLLGTDEAAKKYLAVYIEEKDNFKIQGYISWNLKLLGKTFSLCMLLFILLFSISGYLYVNDYINANYLFFIFLLSIAPVAAFFTLLTSYLLCNKWSYLFLFLKNISVYIFILMFFSMAIMYFKVQIYHKHIFLLFLITFSLSTILGMYIAKKKFKDRFKIKLRNPGDNLFYRKEWLPESIKLAANRFIIFIVNIIPMMIIALLASSKNAMGYFAATLTITSFFWLISASLSTTLLPYIQTLISKNKKDELKDKIKQTYCFNFCAVLALGIAVVIFAKPILNTFGNGYACASNVLVIMVIACFLGATMTPCEKVLTYLSPSVVLKINWIVTAVLIIAGLILTYFFGILGMAYAILIYLALTKIWVMLELRKILISPAASST